MPHGRSREWNPIASLVAKLSPNSFTGLLIVRMRRSNFDGAALLI
jgi:hypothetical protein